MMSFSMTCKLVFLPIRRPPLCNCHWRLAAEYLESLVCKWMLSPCLREFAIGHGWLRLIVLIKKRSRSLGAFMDGTCLLPHLCATGLRNINEDIRHCAARLRIPVSSFYR